MYTVLHELFSYTLLVSCKQCGHALAPFVLNLDRLPRARKSLMVQNNMAYKVKFSRLYASHTCTPSFHSVIRSSSNSARYASISFPGCFGPWISSDIKMYFRFIHNQRGMLYIHRFTGQVLCRLLMLPKEFIPSVLNPNLMFLDSAPNSSKLRSKFLH